MHAGASTGWAAYLPLLIFLGVMAWRFRTVNRARPLRLPLLWIMPLLVTAAVCLALYGMPPTGLGWLSLAAGLAIGGGIGAQRSRLMRLHVEGEGGDARVMVRQSPVALVLILGVFALRRLILPGGGSSVSMHDAHALLITDAMLGFALGMIVFSRTVLWLRAKTLVAHHVQTA
ncbi:CcdC protein domain-containing protein [Novosphingobium sp. Leaf2]|uniref:CcdC protein domain-containing protein n=1 Tax=Novosphingobium sp. Leaf2 TaxID=1735670 RepID=UPI0006FD8636|nr:CcdC protein domain-containing protein [Novosphingobium sp. Leaf2]KQM13870.1 hypothetical protein ASE49_12600 [Novosphingobium sp. Leaf2]